MSIGHLPFTFPSDQGKEKNTKGRGSDVMKVQPLILYLVFGFAAQGIVHSETSRKVMFKGFYLMFFNKMMVQSHHSCYQSNISLEFNSKFVVCNWSLDLSKTITRSSPGHIYRTPRPVCKLCCVQFCREVKKKSVHFIQLCINYEIIFIK